MYELNNMDKLDMAVELISKHIGKDVDINYLGEDVTFYLQGCLKEYDFNCDGLVIDIDGNQISIDVDSFEPYFEEEFEGLMIEFRSRSSNDCAVTILLHD